jgi:hypothetical protein
MSMALKSSPRTKTLVRGDEITAAAEINLDDRTDQNYTRATVNYSRRASERPWDWFHKIGEVHYSITRSARIAGYARLECVRYGDNGEIEDVVDSGMAAEIVSAIVSPFGGSRGLIDRFYTLMKVPGDSYLINVVDDDGDSEGYHFMSPNEMDLSSFSRWRPGSGHLRWITVPATAAGVDGTKSSNFLRDIATEDLLGRIWIPDRQYVDVADSALAALDVECEALHLLTQTIKAKLMSRFAMAGILFIPDTIATARVTRNQSQLAGQPVDDTMNYLIAAMTRNMRSWDDAIAKMPVMLRGPADAGEKIKHIVTDREVFETDIALRRELIDRILMGLDSSQDATKGTGEQNHFSAWASTDDERRVAVQPDLETMCWGLERLVLHRQLQELGMGPEEILRHGVWFDLSAAATRANQQEDARQARDRGLITTKATLRMSGVPKTDLLEEGSPEHVRWVGLTTKNPMLMLYDTPAYDTIDWDKVLHAPAETGPPPDSPADDPEAGPGQGDPGSPDDRETDTPRTKRPV